MHQPNTRLHSSLLALPDHLGDAVAVRCPDSCVRLGHCFRHAGARSCCTWGPTWRSATAAPRAWRGAGIPSRGVAAHSARSLGGERLPVPPACRLLCAASKGHVETLTLLLDSGAKQELCPQEGPFKGAQSICQARRCCCCRLICCDSNMPLATTTTTKSRATRMPVRSRRRAHASARRGA